MHVPQGETECLQYVSPNELLMLHCRTMKDGCKSRLTIPGNQVYKATNTFSIEMFCINTCP